MFHQEVKQQELFIGSVRVNSRMDWLLLDSAVSQAFKVTKYIDDANEVIIQCGINWKLMHILKEILYAFEFFINFVFFLMSLKGYGSLYCHYQILFSLQVYIAKVDPTSSLGLSTDSLFSYSMGHIKRVLGEEAPKTLPSHCMSRDSTGITLALKGLPKCLSVALTILAFKQNRNLH